MDENVIKRKLPYNSEAEKSVIGSMMLDNMAIDTARDSLTADDFYMREYMVMFEAIGELHDAGKPVDIMTLHEQLMHKELAPELSEIKHLGEIMGFVPTSANVKFYIEIVKNKAIERNLIRTLESLASDVYMDKAELSDLLENTEKEVFKVVQNKGSSGFEDISDIVLAALNKIDVASRNKGRITGVATGFSDLDYKLAGLQKSDLVLLAARPSMGKTAFVINIANYVAVHSKITTAIFSLEMSKEQLVNRMLSMNSRVDAQKIRTGDLKDTEWSDLIEAGQSIGNSGLVIDDTPGISIADLRSKCRKLKLEKDLGLVIIDYLQLMSGSGKSESRQQEISEISRSLKALAREINCPVVALSQLSRAVEQRPDKRPMMSDLRESGAIEQDADVVMFIYRDEYYNKEKSEEPGIAEIIIAKQRNGPTGTVKLKWIAEHTRFANLIREDQNNFE